MIAFAIAAFTLSFYFFLRLTCGKTKSFSCLVGKTAIITGANTGIGYQVALNLAMRGCRVIIADKDDSEASKRKIIEETGNSNVICKHLDLASFKSIRKFCQDINMNERRLDILIHNAGIGGSSNQYTEDRLHQLMQINSFGPFLLTHLLIDLLKRSMPSRIIFTSSIMAFFHNLSMQTLNFPENIPSSFLVSNIIYANSKMCNILIADGFARKLENTGITSNSLHPGATNTAIFNKTFTVLQVNRVLFYVVSGLMWLFGKNALEGAQTTIHLAVAKELQDCSGYYFWDCVVFPKPPLAKNQEFREQVWEALEKLCLLPNEKIKAF